MYRLQLRFLPALVAGLLLMGVMLTGCGATGANGPALAASVNGHGIALSDYQGMLAFYKASTARQASVDWRTPAGRGELVSAENSTLDFLINLELIHEQLSAKHLTVAQKDITTARQQLDSQIKAAQSQGTSSLAPLVSALTPRVRDLFVEQQVDVQTLAAHISVPTVHARGILVQSKADAEKLLTQATQGTDFGQLAKDNSKDSATAVNGGELGTIYIGQFGGDFDTKVFSVAKPPKYVITQAGTGYALFEVTQPGEKPLSGVQDAQTQQSVLDAWLKMDVRSHANVQRYVTTG
jgi:hypothetical protein